MSQSTANPEGGAPPHEELQTALFLDLVAQQANMALIFLGQVPHPQTGQRVRDLETARMFIDQLEMIEAKTKGNLNKHEESLLKQSLMATRLAFVEAIESRGATPPAAAEPPSGPAAPAATPVPGTPAAPASEVTPPQSEAGPSSAAAEEARTKFVKKY